MYKHDYEAYESSDHYDREADIMAFLGRRSAKDFDFPKHQSQRFNFSTKNE